MIRASRTAVGRDLDRLFRLGAGGSATDTQLLELFIGGNDESASLAFEAIVERHGPMVLRTCRTVLGDLHAAEDAFQATFLVLARKARTLGSRELLGNWLYGVAIRIARKARRLALASKGPVNASPCPGRAGCSRRRASAIASKASCTASSTKRSTACPGLTARPSWCAICKGSRTLRPLRSLTLPRPRFGAGLPAPVSYSAAG